VSPYATLQILFCHVGTQAFTASKHCFPLPHSPLPWTRVRGGKTFEHIHCCCEQVIPPHGNPFCATTWSENLHQSDEIRQNATSCDRQLILCTLYAQEPLRQLPLQFGRNWGGGGDTHMGNARMQMLIVIYCEDYCALILSVTNKQKPEDVSGTLPGSR
jgi:hypothetical protein